MSGAVGVVVALTLSLLPGSAPGPAPAPTPVLKRAVLSSDGATYHYRYVEDRLAIRASRSGKEPNRREVLVDKRAPVRHDQLTCATWTRQSSWRVQPGLAVRVVDRGGRVRAVTLTKNIAFGVQTVINVLTWDTARSGEPWHQIGQYDVVDVVARDGKLLPLPWRVCMRVAGRRLAFKIWPLGRVPHPSWSDSRYVRRAKVPKAFDIAGRPGWYIGHVPSRGTAGYSDLLTR